MGDYDSRGRLYEGTQYRALAAGSTTAIGGSGGYLESLTVIPLSSAAGVVTVLDGTVGIISIPAAAYAPQPLPFTVRLGIRSTTSGGFTIGLGTSVSCIAVGKFASD
jgi:hypothetical protein